MVRNTTRYSLLVDSAGVYHSRSSCSNLAICSPHSGRPVSSLHCDPAPASCPSSVLQVCQETEAGLTSRPHYWCVEIESKTKRPVHRDCPSQCLPHQEGQLSLGLYSEPVNFPSHLTTVRIALFLSGCWLQDPLHNLHSLGSNSHFLEGDISKDCFTTKPYTTNICIFWEIIFLKV